VSQKKNIYLYFSEKLDQPRIRTLAVVAKWANAKPLDYYVIFVWSCNFGFMLQTDATTQSLNCQLQSLN